MDFKEKPARPSGPSAGEPATLICRLCSVKIEWTGHGKVYVDSDLSPFCGDSRVAHEPDPDALVYKRVEIPSGPSAPQQPKCELCKAGIPHEWQFCMKPPHCPECKTQLRDEAAWYRCDTCHARYSSSMERGLYRLPDDRFPSPQPVSGDAPLRISFDIGGVLSKYPEVFRPMVDALQRGGAEVFVITDMHEHEKSVRFVRDNGYDIPAERILNSDYTAHGECCKAETIKQHGIKIHLDDFAGYCAHTECVSLFVWPNPTKPYYADDFKTDGTEGDFGRRKAAKI